jgi:hypothetical protein
MAEKLAGIGQYELVDPEFTAGKPTAATLAIAKANAAPGQTAEEYLASRGGVNAAGYYGDSWNAKLNLTDTEYFKALNDARAAGKTGAALGAAINAATQAKRGIVIEENNNNSNINNNNLNNNANNVVGDNTGPTLASDVFKQTLAIFFGASEMAKPWANELYKVVSKFYKQGATSEESFNMALLESRNNPAMAEFTKRFKGIFALQDMKQAGKAVTVPTIAEYFATESKMGDMLKASNLGDLANEDFLGDVLSKGVSATEFGNRITQIFDRIDNAPDVIKNTIGRYFPTLDRVQLAKALALGDKGAKQLEQELAGYEVLAGAGAQGLEASTALPGGITLEQAQQIAKAGGTYASTLGQFGQIARARETEQKLAEISGVKSIGVTGLTSAVISKSAAELKKLEDLTMQEEARFAAKAGTSPRALASQSRINRAI